MRYYANGIRAENRWTDMDNSSFAFVVCAVLKMRHTFYRTDFRATIEHIIGGNGPGWGRGGWSGEDKDSRIPE